MSIIRLMRAAMIFRIKPTKKLTTFDRKLAASKMLSSSNHTPVSCDAPLNRRSANYKPPLWDFNFVQSLNSEYLLELIDDLQKMGICYHFEEEIKKVLTSIYNTRYKSKKTEDLYSMALQFRLLRQHGFLLFQEIFDCFKNEEGDFNPCLGEDTKGLLQLYEASHLLTEGEETLEAAKEFATFFLRKNLEEGTVGVLDESVRHSLEMPLHWRVPRPNARWFIEEYGRRPDMNPLLLEFAKLDFNIVQATHQQELKHISRWWKSAGLAEKFPFARDRLVECYFWNIGWLPGPQNGYLRINIAKFNSLITIIDDIFDVYGTLEELQLLHDVIQRWDIGSMNQLPEYMQMCYLALNDLVDETAYHVLKEQGLVIIPHLRNLWKDLVKVYLQESKWYANGYTPSLDEYINIAWISIGSPLMLSSALFLKPNPTHKEATQILMEHNDLIRWSGIIFRLSNDLGTSKEEMERGDIPKSIQCYMNQSGASKEEAEEHVRGLIHSAWKKMNQNLHQKDYCEFARIFAESGADLSRMSMYMYEHGDGHGNQNPQIKNRISNLLSELFIV
ncbi:terpene synthase 10-like isoform X2 [Henckelia pumila]|uniref:terpene synthase 10-like isoform X2 n=1 Tax=Henckelia pumila TaxID=405737 RepID=UPI003C6DC087